MSQYMLKMERSHTGETRKVSHGARGESALELPLRQAVIVEFQSGPDPFQMSPEEVVALASPHATPDPQLPQDGWKPWRAKMLREAYTFAEPDPLCFPSDSPAGKALANSLDRHRQLFGSGPFAAYKVLEHWFCSVGNGLDWQKDGTLSDGLTDEERQRYERADREEGKKIEHTAEDRRLLFWDQKPCMRPPVSLYPLSRNHSNLYSIPLHVEDSFLFAAWQLAVFLLKRPVWENFAYDPDDLISQDRSVSRRVWESDEWRHVTLANGAKYRTLVEEAYCQIVLSPLGARLKKMGLTEPKLYPLDYRLPPRAKRFRP